MIDAYLTLIANRSLRGNWNSVFALPFSFFGCLRIDGYKAVKQADNLGNIFSRDLIMFPILKSAHWSLAIFQVHNSTLSYYDSFGGQDDDSMELLKNFLCEHSKRTRNIPLEVIFKYPKNIPKQLNLDDCGTFICSYAEFISRGVPLSFSQNDMRYFRKKMVIELLEGELIIDQCTSCQNLLVPWDGVKFPRYKKANGPGRPCSNCQQWYHLFCMSKEERAMATRTSNQKKNLPPFRCSKC